MKNIVILSNDHSYTYNFRKELIKKLIEEEYRVYIVLPYGENIKKLEALGCIHIDLPLDRRGTNPFKDIKLLIGYYKIMNRIKPNLVISYTIKPNIYGGIICRFKKISFIPNVTGLGTALENNGLIRRILMKLYKFAYKDVNLIFFQNKRNLNFFVENSLVDLKKTKLIPGSGVNIDKFIPRKIEKKENKIRFLFIGRLMKDKGIDEYLEAANNITNKYENTEFQILGSFEEGKYKEILKTNKNTRIKYLGRSNDVREEISQVDCIVNPSYHEGMSNVLLEGAAMGKPLIASDIPGCKEIIDDGINGFLFEVKNVNDLENKIIKFINLSNEKKVNMGIQSRKKVVKEFDRKIVVNEYMKVINSILKGDM